MLDLGAVAVGLALLLSAVGPASAADGPAQVAVLVPAGIFQVGDTVTVSVHVFDFGAPADPTNLTVTVYGAVERNVTYVRQAVGVYASTFQVLATDLTGHSYVGAFDSVPIEVNATFAAVAAFGWAAVPVYSLPAPLTMTLSAPGGWLSPGANVSVEATVTASGSPANPTALAVWANLNMPYGGYFYNIPVSMTQTGTGRYSGVYRIPADTPLGSSLTFGGQASLDTLTAYGSSGSLGVGYGAPWVLWQHVVEVAPTYTLLEIFVANGTGWPVVAANVSLYHPAGQCYQRECDTHPWVSAITDRRGAASFNLTYAFSPVPMKAYLGNVSVGGLSQIFSGLIVSPSLYQPYRSLCPSDGLESYAPGQTITRTYRASCGILGIAPAAPNQTYDYVAHTLHGLVASGTVRADSQGNFNLTFTLPPESVVVEFATNVTARGWLHFADAIVVGDPGQIHISNLTMGKVAQITVDLVNVSGSVAWSPYDATDMANPVSADWIPLTCCKDYDLFPAMPGSSFHADLVLPRFLPKDRDYLLAVIANGTTFGTGYVYAHVFHTANLPPAAAATFSTLKPAAAETVTANASSSSDPDGVIMGYRFDWGDGNSTGWMNTSGATHVYPIPGTYTVTVLVRDDSGVVNNTTYSVVVEPTILGVRASTFYVVVVIVAAASVVVAMYLRRIRRRPPESTREAGTKPPEAS